MPIFEHTDAHGSSSASPKKLKTPWLGWPPRLVGIMAMVLFALPTLATIWNMYQRADHILQQSIQHQLLSAARVIAREVDPEIHGSFHTPAQETSEAYLRQLRLMDRAKVAIDADGVIKFVYTCVERGGQIYFVLDTTPVGDADGDGKDDKSHIMELYEQPSATLRAVLKSGIAAVDAAPYQDRWGTFMSAYAPIVNEDRQIIGVAGVDMAMMDYDLERSGIRHLAIISAIGVLCLSYIAALGVAAYHRRLQRSVKQLVSASEAAMAAARTKADFLAAMSHELRTPLNAVIGMSELLRETPLTANQKSFVSTIISSSESLLGTLTDILDFSQLDSGRLGVDRVPVSLKAMVRELQSHFQQDLQRKNLAFHVEMDAACPERILAGPEYVRQVLRHLTLNAIKFTESGGSIHLIVKPELVAPGRPGIHFTVRDTGIGIAAEQLQRLFLPFFQGDGSTTRRYGGTGIGLAICQRLCEAMDGRIWVESQLGRGSAFHVEIPAEAVDTPAVESSPDQEREALVWSQDMITQMVVSRVVEKLGHRVHIVSAYDEVRGELAKRSVEWLLLDGPLLSPESLSQLKEQAGRARIIVLNVEPGGWATGAEIDAVLPLPVRPADLRQILEA